MLLSVLSVDSRSPVATQDRALFVRVVFFLWTLFLTEAALLV
jgi:hypothetical protein